MEDDIPRGGTLPEMDMDPEVELLPLRIRPFDPTTYRPAIHVLPPDGIRHFRSYTRGAPLELLLREPESHLSFGAAELWVYAYFPRHAACPSARCGDAPPMVPCSHRYNVRCEWRPRESFLFFRRYFDTITAAEITWQPWAMLPDIVRDRYMGARETARFQILLESPVCRAWYFGERFLRLTLGLLEQIVPRPPPTHTRATERYTPEEMTDYTIGWDSDLFQAKGDYAEFIQTYLIRPLIGARRVERETCDASGRSRSTEGNSGPWQEWVPEGTGS
ncbi:uncharacterized protein LOC114273186 [Camellia sinensis]|uniref:uncharacterized protein LOC114273186 n=1 Tax=Camellia sinensis TaxID=4442 RepID=UPI0010364443|nr:uncharacterized protein LOC114273186 [Camellia sinensis]